MTVDPDKLAFFLPYVAFDKQSCWNELYRGGCGLMALLLSPKLDRRWPTAIEKSSKEAFRNIYFRR